MTRPLIGLTGGRIHGRDIAGNLDVLNNSPVDIYYADYSQAVIAAGGLPVYLPIDVPPAEVIGQLDGLLVTGGDDIAAARYGAEPAPQTHAPEPLRDEFELALLAAAIKRELPTLGICRGLQMVNVHAGGTLHQHVPEHTHVDNPSSGDHHTITLVPDSTLAGLYGTRSSVNSLHHQAVDVLGADLRVTAIAQDGGIEGIEHNAVPVIAVQWHPEMLATAASDPVFTWLVARSSD